ncbi:biotin transporter BioY [Fictibacillus phosphorivorans]|uniref:biotin transporter BioY n=1 Tax=Fictibacillus phosphorivorans TaxID=1221500 RepID=UPI00204127AF|nr:biotin transporter BioY [Fictibacillus phosphorivorans]MCM3719233.1 biotin transporter BioY [Fictibacillus phosphorivorans]MCM3776855.1 biotin transporter BioY [Fictibacillus phosphorivorans]
MTATRKSLKTIDITLIGMFVALMAIGANITTIFPFMVVGGVPITLQTFFCILAGALLGSRLGAIAMSVYVLVGLVGAPVFAQFKGGFATLVSPTFGFLLSFILVAYVTGKIIENNGSKASYIVAALVGTLINYIAGTNLMFMAYKMWAAAPEGFTYSMAWGWMMVPLPKDIILAVCAGLIAPRINIARKKVMPHQTKHAS